MTTVGKTATKGMAVEKTFVPENVLKKRTRDAKLHDEKTKAHAKRTEDQKTKTAEYRKRGEAHHQAHAKHERSLVEARRSARAQGGFYVPSEAKVFLITRIRGINNLSPIVRQILKLLRLRQLHNASFIKINKATINMIRRVEPYIAYGYPTRKTISELVYKRGFGRINKQRIPLSNELVEQHLGKHGLICVEDLINELVTCGPHFKEANSFMWYFKLNSPKGGFNNKRHPFQTGGDWGNREELINDLVQRMI
jgi:large subunit ribosomal protein L7e